MEPSSQGIISMEGLVSLEEEEEITSPVLLPNTSPYNSRPSSPTHCICWDSSRRTKWRSAVQVSSWKQFTLFTMALMFICIYQLSINLNLLAQEETKSKKDFLRTNNRAIKSLHSLDHVISKDGFFPGLALKRHGPKSHDISCSALLKGDENEITKAKKYMSNNPPVRISDTDYMQLTQNCTQFRADRGYFQKPLSKEEAEFPLAFSILTYKGVEQVERLLRAIYMPQNYYCIHIDTKASESVKQAIQSITDCFPNVFIASKLESIYWGHVSIVNAELTCLHDLLKYKWKYYLNLSGQMFPLQTNANLVKILKMYNGANDIEGTYQRNRRTWMFWRQVVSWKLVEWCGCLLMTPHLKDAAPHNITIYKGSNQVAASRAFVRFALYSQPARDLLDWLKDTHAPDEYFLPTLNHNVHLNAPGGYRGDPENKVFTARATIWAAGHDQINWSWKKRECRGKWVHNICILGVGDLQWVAERPELFLNKIFLDFEPLTLDCVEELLYNRTISNYKSNFIPSYYDNLDIVKHRELVNINYTAT